MTRRLNILAGSQAGQRVLMSDEFAAYALADGWGFDSAELPPGEPWPVGPGRPWPDSLLNFEVQLRTFDEVTGYPTSADLMPQGATQPDPPDPPDGGEGEGEGEGEPDPPADPESDPESRRR